MTEAEFVGIADKIVCLLASKFKFGYFDVDDIKQYGRLYAWQALDSYDASRPLENFLYTHIKNRLINLKRDKYSRNDPPCKTCAAGNLHNDGNHCSRHLKWLKRNTTKKNILIPLDIDNISHDRESRTRVESSVLEDVACDELLQIIDRKLPIELRATYLQMRDGVHVPKNKRQEVENAVLDILRGNICPTNEDR